jgi:hypothetical protein
MNQSDFFLNLLEYSYKEGFRFLNPEDQIEPQNLSTGMKLFATAAVSTYAPLGVFSIGEVDGSNKADLITDLKKMHEFAYLVGLMTKTGIAVVRLGINADDTLDG